MTDTAITTTATTSHQHPDVSVHHDDGISASDMRKSGFVLLLGALAVALAVKEIGPLDYYWDPPLIGLVFLAAAAVSGRLSPLWGTGLIVTFWGASKVLQNNTEFTWTGPFSTVMIGLGGVLAAYLLTRGFAISVGNIAWPIVFIGLGQYIHSTYSGWPITGYVCALTAARGVYELVNASRLSGRVDHAH